MRLACPGTNPPLTPPQEENWLHRSTPGQKCLATVSAQVFQQSRDQGRPAGLVFRAEATAVVAVKIFVKQHQSAPVRIASEARVVANARPLAIRVGQEESREACGELARDLFQVQPLA